MGDYLEQFAGDGELDVCWQWEYAVCAPFWAVAVYRDEQRAIKHRDELIAQGQTAKIERGYSEKWQTLNHRNDIWLGTPFYV
jgi:hypothetical protein